jgi:hypothetical protein
MTEYSQARPLGQPSPVTGLPLRTDIRPYYVAAQDALYKQSGHFVARDVIASRRVLTELPADATPFEVMNAGEEFKRQAAEALGIRWPKATQEQWAELGIHWSLAPNISLVPGGLGGSLVFRSRPNGSDPESCIFELGALERVAPGADLAPKVEFFENWREHTDKMFRVLAQDCAMVEEVQRGMRSPTFVGARTNPVQERMIVNNHRVIEDYIYGPA